LEIERGKGVWGQRRKRREGDWNKNQARRSKKTQNTRGRLSE